METPSKMRSWKTAGILSSMVIPALFAVVPNVRKRYNLGVFSIPSIAMIGGLWLWERHVQKRAHA